MDNVIGGKESVEFFDVAKMHYLGQTLKESLRKHPVVGGIARVTTKAEKFGQYLIPKGANLHFSIFVSHHLPEFWDNPESFLPERFADNVKPSNFVYLPFSCGPRICIGKVFSAINATIIMARIFQKFKFQLVGRLCSGMTISQFSLRMESCALSRKGYQQFEFLSNDKWP